jgi:predicted ATP-binding protein involved in virulence
MELVYLWVEEYKNIKKQVFFPDNINITAIVGENGSGKSTVSTMIQILFYI